MATQAELMRTCAPLYPSFALESLASLLLFFFFAYLSIIISSKQQLKTPGVDICRFVWNNIADWATDTYRVLSRWPLMDEMDLGQRFRYCRRLNATICRFSACFALISITRWLHVNNVNGFRYLSYAVTCPLMQAELVMLIAPIVPFYRVVVAFTCAITASMLLSGYTASQFEGQLWDTSLHDIVVEGNFHNLTTKGWLTVPSVVILSFLSLVQIPMLGFLFCRNGGSKTGKLPDGYSTLLLITAITWWGFPIWWMLSYEGMSIITDTRLNGVGFVCLNMISKGGYTLHMIGMVKRFKKSHPAPADPEEGRSGDLKMGHRMSISTLPDLPPVGNCQKDGSFTARADRRLPSAQSLVWFVDYMKKYEQGRKGSEDDATALATADDDRDLKGGQRVMIKDASLLSDQELMQELTSRLSLSSADCSKASTMSTKSDWESLLDLEISRACTQFVIEEEDSEQEEEAK